MERWKIEVLWKSPAEDGSLAEIKWISNYDQASLRFAKNWQSWSPEAAEQTIVHELLHLHFRNLEFHFGSVKDRLGVEVGEVADLTFTRELEGVVDRLAYRFVELV